jgi:hypothetical protein
MKPIHKIPTTSSKNLIFLGSLNDKDYYLDADYGRINSENAQLSISIIISDSSPGYIRNYIGKDNSVLDLFARAQKISKMYDVLK